jgi:VanZ family protein
MLALISTRRWLDWSCLEQELAVAVMAARVPPRCETDRPISDGHQQRGRSVSRKLAATLRLAVGAYGVVLAALTLGAMISFGIELAQVPMSGIHRADVNDVIPNTLGSGLGWLALRLGQRVAAHRATRS